MRWTIRAFLSIFILLSYFHKTPFPLDKPLITTCTILYFVCDGLLWLFDRYVLKYEKFEYDVDSKKFKKYT